MLEPLVSRQRCCLGRLRPSGSGSGGGGGRESGILNAYSLPYFLALLPEPSRSEQEPAAGLLATVNCLHHHKPAFRVFSPKSREALTQKAILK